jgi:hypothetical protein
MKNSGFTNRNEMLAAEYRPLIDVFNPRENRFDRLLVALLLIAIITVVMLWTN